MLADATGKAPQTRIHIARITGVNPKDENGTPTVTGFNATYKAISIATYDTPPAEDDKGNPDPENDTRITVPKDVAQYDIQDTFEPTAWVDPITRPVGDPDKIPLRINSGPAGLGDLCFIVIDTIPSNGPIPPITFHALMAWEKIDSSPCSSASSSALPPDPLGEAMTMAAMGVI